MHLCEIAAASKSGLGHARQTTMLYYVIDVYKNVGEKVLLSFGDSLEAKGRDGILRRSCASSHYQYDSSITRYRYQVYFLSNESMIRVVHTKVEIRLLFLRCKNHIYVKHRTNVRRSCGDISITRGMHHVTACIRAAKDETRLLHRELLPQISDSQGRGGEMKAMHHYTFTRSLIFYQERKLFPQMYKKGILEQNNGKN